MRWMYCERVFNRPLKRVNPKGMTHRRMAALGGAN